MSKTQDILSELQKLQDGFIDRSQGTRRKLTVEDDLTPTEGERIKSRAGRYLEGAVQSSVGSMLGLAAFSARKAGADKVADFFAKAETGIEEAAAGVYEEQKAKVDNYTQLGGNQGWEAFAEDTLPRMAGSSGGMAATGGALGGGKIAMGAAGAVTEAVSLYNEAKARNATEGDATAAFFLGLPLGASEGFFGFGKYLGELDNRIGGSIGKALVRIATTTGEESAQEAIQTALENAVAIGIYDPGRGWKAGVKDAAIGGALLGFLGAGVGEVARPPSSANADPLAKIKPGEPSDVGPAADAAARAGMTPAPSTDRPNVTQLDQRAPLPLVTAEADAAATGATVAGMTVAGALPGKPIAKPEAIPQEWWDGARERAAAATRGQGKEAFNAALAAEPARWQAEVNAKADLQAPKPKGTPVEWFDAASSQMRQGVVVRELAGGRLQVETDLAPGAPADEDASLGVEGAKGKRAGKQLVEIPGRGVMLQRPADAPDAVPAPEEAPLAEGEVRKQKPLLEPLPVKSQAPRGEPPAVAPPVKGKARPKAEAAVSPKEGEDPLLAEARKLKTPKPFPSTSLIQRALGLGYTRAAQLSSAIKAERLAAQESTNKPSAKPANSIEPAVEKTSLVAIRRELPKPLDHAVAQAFLEAEGARLGVPKAEIDSTVTSAFNRDNLHGDVAQAVARWRKNAPAGRTPAQAGAEAAEDPVVQPEVTPAEVEREERRARPRGGPLDEVADKLRSEAKRLGASKQALGKALADLAAQDEKSDLTGLQLVASKHVVEWTKARRKARVRAKAAAVATEAQENAERQPWEMTRKEWEAARTAARPGTVQRQGTKSAPSEAQTNMAAAQFLTYGVRDADTARMKAAAAGEVNLGPGEFEDLRERLDSLVTHREVVEKALAEGKPVPAGVLKAYPSLSAKKAKATSLSKRGKQGKNSAQSEPVAPAPTVGESAEEAPASGKKPKPKRSTRRYPSGAVGAPATVVDHVVHAGGIDLRKDGRPLTPEEWAKLRKNEAGDLWERLRKKEAGKHIPGLIYGPFSKAAGRGMTPDDMTTALHQAGFLNAAGEHPDIADLINWLDEEVQNGIVRYAPGAKPDVTAAHEAAEREKLDAQARAEGFENAEEAFAYHQSLGDGPGDFPWENAAPSVEDPMVTLPQEEGMFGDQEKAPAPRKEGAPVKGTQTQLWTGQKDQRGQQSLEDMMDAEAQEKAGGIFGSPSRVLAPTNPITATTTPTPKHLMPIGDRLLGRTAVPIDQRPKGKKAVSAPDVIASLARILRAAGSKAPIREGAVGRKRGAEGYFKVGPEIIRIRTANSISTAAHEVGHALEKAVFGWVGNKVGPWTESNVGKPVVKELFAMGKKLYGNQKPEAGYRREGWAEFVYQWVTNERSEVQKVAPATLAWFEDNFLKQHPEVAKAFEEAHEFAKRWREQGSAVRVQKSIVDKATLGARAKNLLQAARRAVSVRAWIESAIALEQVGKAAGESLGRTLGHDEDPFLMLSARRMTHSGIASYMVEHGMVDFAGNKVGPALMEIRPLIAGRYDEFLRYLYARRSVALLQDPRARNPGISLEDATQELADLGSHQFELAADKVYAWTDGVLEYAAQSSPTFRKTVEAIRASDPGNYIPLQRIFQEMDSLWSKAGKRSTGGSITQRLKGSGRQIKDPLQALIAQAERTVLAAHRRAVLDRIMALSKVEGMGFLVDEVQPPQVPVAQRSVADLVETLQKKLYDLTGEDLELPPEMRQRLEDQGTDLIGETVTFFAPTRDVKPGDSPILPIWDGAAGKMRWFEMNPDVYATLSSLESYHMGKAADLLLGVPARLFRSGATGLRASFGLITNPARDIQTLALNTRSDASAPRLLLEYLKLMGTSLRYAATGTVKNPYFDAWLSLGGQLANSLGQDMPHTRRSARRLAGRRSSFFDPRNLYDFYRDLVQFPESGPRVAEFKLMADEVGWTPGQPMSVAQANALTLFAKQVTTDFTASGEIARVINQMIPFHNAAIQGPRAHARAFKHHPARFAWRGLSLTAATLAIWWRYKDEDWYKELSLRERMTHWHIPFGKNGLARIPRSFEVGMLFAALPEMLADTWYNEDPASATAWFSQMFSTAAPPVVPPVFHEAAEQLANRDFFMDRPIVPQGELRRPAEQQFNEYTTRVAVKIGGLFNVSPRRVDHAIRGIAAGVGADLASVLGRGGGEGKASVEHPWEPSDIPVLGAMFRRGGRISTSNRSVDALYSELEEAQRLQYDQTHEETEDEQQRRLMLADAASAVSALSYARSQSEDEAQRAALLAESLGVARDTTAATKENRVKETRAQVRKIKKDAEFVEKSLKEEGAWPDSMEQSFMEIVTEAERLEEDFERATDTGDEALKERVRESPLWDYHLRIKKDHQTVQGIQRRLKDQKDPEARKRAEEALAEVHADLVTALAGAYEGRLSSRRNQADAIEKRLRNLRRDMDGAPDPASRERLRRKIEALEAQLTRGLAAAEN